MGIASADIFLSRCYQIRYYHAARLARSGGRVLTLHQGIWTMEAMLEAGDRTVTIALTEQELAKLSACARYRQMSVVEVVQHYLNDWIDTDYPAATGTFSRRQLYRDYP